MTIELHTLKSAPGARKDRKRVGRGQGSGNGKTAGRGHKGQKSRSGYSSKAGFEGGQMPIHRRLPKRGFYHEKRHPLAEVNLDVLENRFADGDEITVDKLRTEGIIKVKRGGVKLLGRGEITKRFLVHVQAVSATAREKIEKVGGTLTLVEMEVEEGGKSAQAMAAVAVETPAAPTVAEAAPETPEAEENAPEVEENAPEVEE